MRDLFLYDSNYLWTEKLMLIDSEEWKNKYMLTSANAFVMIFDWMEIKFTKHIERERLMNKSSIHTEQTVDFRTVGSNSTCSKLKIDLFYLECERKFHT